jgi:hypothetical protein
MKKTGNGVSLADVLYEVLYEQSQHVWTKEDVRDCRFDLIFNFIYFIYLTSDLDRRL